MSTAALLVVYVVVALGALAVTALFYGFRDRSFGPTRSNDQVFRCGGCGYVYTDDPDVDRSRCPQCGRMNEAVRF